MADPEISVRGGYQPSWGSGGRCKPPSGARGEAPGHQFERLGGQKSGGGGYIPPIPPPLDPRSLRGLRILRIRTRAFGPRFREKLLLIFQVNPVY